MNEEFDLLKNEDRSSKSDCQFCKEAKLEVGEKTNYGSVIVGKFGNGGEGWFATLSPKTGGDPKKDLTLQLMPNEHLTHFSQTKLDDQAKNYGVAFAKLTSAMSEILAEDKTLKSVADSRETGIPLATYGKCTTWKEKKEHLHVKIFPFRGDIGQPSTVDSSFGKKEVHHNGEDYVKMIPVKKTLIDPERFQEIKEKLVSLLK